MPRGEYTDRSYRAAAPGSRPSAVPVRGKDRRGQIPNMVPIHQRPAEIEERVIPGHWEGDTVKGKYNRSAVGTLVERSTLFTLLAKMDNCGAEAAVVGFSRVLDRVEAQKRLSITYDRGKEMAMDENPRGENRGQGLLRRPARALAARHQRKHNGLIRQYLPKGEDSANIRRKNSIVIAWNLNSRPRKSLGWKCPAELFLPDFDFVKYYTRFFALRS